MDETQSADAIRTLCHRAGQRAYFVRSQIDAAMKSDDENRSRHLRNLADSAKAAAEDLMAAWAMLDPGQQSCVFNGEPSTTRATDAQAFGRTIAR